MSLNYLEFKQKLRNKIQEFIRNHNNNTLAHPTKERKRIIHMGSKEYELNKTTTDAGTTGKINLVYKSGVLYKIYVDTTLVYTNEANLGDWSIVFNGTTVSTTKVPFSTTVTKIIYEDDYIVDYDGGVLNHTYSTSGDHIVRFVGKPTSLNNSAFSTNNQVISVHLPNTITSIAQYCFSGCSNLKYIELPEGLTNLGANTFLNCTNLTSITLPSTLTSMGLSVFSKSGLKSISIPSGITNTNTGTFKECANLTTVELPEGLTGIANMAFQYCTSLKDINFPSTLTSIGTSSFSKCAFTSLVLPEGFLTLGDSAFTSCTNLTSITFPSTLTRIGKNCFWGCTGLTKITLPASLTTIRSGGFINCTNLKDITFLSTTPPELLSNTVFGENPTGLTITVPKGTLTAYTTATNYPDPTTNTYKEAT